MSLIEAVKWFAIYILLTLGFTAITALGAFIYVRVSVISYEFDTMFFLFLFFAGLFLVAVGAVIIIRTHLLTLSAAPIGLEEILQERHIRTERKDGILLILVGLTLILVSITKLWI